MHTTIYLNLFVGGWALSRMQVLMSLRAILHSTSAQFATAASVTHSLRGFAFG
jgi:hypothetical protein